MVCFLYFSMNNAILCYIYVQDKKKVKKGNKITLNLLQEL